MASGVLGTRRTERIWFCTRQSFPLRVLLCPPLFAGAAAVNFSIKALMLEKKGLEAAASLLRTWFSLPLLCFTRMR